MIEPTTNNTPQEKSASNPNGIKEKSQQKVSQVKTLYDVHIKESQISIFLIVLGIFLFLWQVDKLQIWFDQKLMAKFFNNYFTDPLGPFLGGLYLALAGITYYYLYERYWRVNYIARVTTMTVTMFAVTIYFAERVFLKSYVFTPVFSYQVPYPAILDVVFFPAALMTIRSLYVIFAFKLIKRETNSINPDRPIENKSGDQYEREKFAEDFARNIDTLDSRHSFVIGINGKWGYGKTSVLNLIRDELSNDSIKIVFNPWMARGETNIILDFFNALEEELSKFTGTSNVFSKYGQSLANINAENNPFTFIKGLLHEEPLQKKLLNLTSLIAKTNRKVYIFVDDIDRLSKEEVYETLRLIRNSTYFPNMIFIVAYDRTYIEAALENLDIPQSKIYLEKVIQLEVNLPKISNTLIEAILIKELTHQIKRIFSTDGDELEVKEMIEYLVLGHSSDPSKKYLITNVIANIFFNKRDIIRFVNSFTIRLTLSPKTIYIPDLFILELIRFYEPSLFDRISKKGDNFALQTLNNTSIRKLKLEKEDDGISIDVPSIMPHLELTYLKTDPDRYLTNKTLMEALMEEPLSYHMNHDKGISYDEYYDTYFTLVTPKRIVTKEFVEDLIFGK